MSLEEKMTTYREICQQIRKLEQEKKVLAQDILKEMPSKKMIFADYIARSYKRLSIRISIEQARILDATKMVEQVDKDRVKEIHSSGAIIEGVKEISYLIVTSTKTPSLDEIPSDLTNDEP
jgi:hypothetical protein